MAEDETKKKAPNRRRADPFSIAGAGATFVTTLLASNAIYGKLGEIQSDVAQIKAERKVDSQGLESSRRELEELGRRVAAVERTLDRIADRKDSSPK